MSNLIRLTIPPVLSILVVWAIFAVEATIHNLIVAPYEDSQANYSFFILPVIVISILIQAILINPIWRKFISKRVVFGIRLIPFFTILCVIGGLACGYFLSVKKFGFSDLVLSCLISVVTLTVYMTVNLLALNQLQKLFKANNHA